MAFNPQDYIIKLKGKDYLEVKWRLVWFREDNDPKDPQSLSIRTEVIQDDGEQALIKAFIEDQNGRLLSTGMKREHKKEFYDYVEKAETGAIGRALALVGYGTQFADEFELPEGKLVDAPIVSKNNKPSSNSSDDDEKAKRKAEALAKAKANQEAKKGKDNDIDPNDIPFDKDEQQEESNNSPITDGQLKAISNLLKLIDRRRANDENYNTNSFVAEVLGTVCGKSTVEELTEDEAKEAIQAFTKEMKKR